MSDAFHPARVLARLPLSLFPLALVACEPGSTSPDDPSATGELRMTITRSPTSLVPSIADSAFVRVWHPTEGTNVVQRIQIPQPGTSTNIALVLPARAGYSVGVIAYRWNAAGTLREALAAARADNVGVTRAQATDVSLNAALWRAQLTGPDTIYSGGQTTVTATVVSGPVADFLAQPMLHVGLEPWTNLGGLPVPSLGATLIGMQFSSTFTAPTVQRDTSAWLQLAFAADDVLWETGGVPLRMFVPSLTLGDTLFRRPLSLGTGSVNVTFSPGR